MPLPFRTTNQRNRGSQQRTDAEKRRGLYIGPNSEERRRIINFLHAGDTARRAGSPGRQSRDTIKKARRRLIAVFLALLAFALWGLLAELL
ncbi:MAG: hypothetical protein ACOCWJ_02765 [Verrucomicrobiota bacterium]